MTTQQKGFIYTILSAICFASGGLLIKLNSWSSLSISGSRSIFAFIVFLIYMKKTNHAIRFNFPILIGVLANSLMSLTFIMANKLTSAANAIILQFTLPIYIMLLLWIMEKKRPDRISIVSALLSFTGILFFFFDSISAGGTLGNILAIVSGFFYAVVFVIKRIPGADFESSALISFALNFVIGLPFYPRETDFSTVNLVTVVLLGVVQIGCAYIFLNAALDKLPPVGVSLISMLEPILNPILVAIFYGETIGKISLIGGVIVLSSAFYYNLRSSSDAD